MRLVLPALLALTHCGGGVICGEGTISDADGNCIVDETPEEIPEEEPVEEPDLEDVLLDAQPCEPLAADDRLDPIGGCADGVCAKMQFRDGVQAVQRMPECGPGAQSGWLSCRWESGVIANVYDSNEDGQPQGAEPIWWVSVEPPFGGASEEGLGLGISPGCFVEAFGAPNTVTLYEGEDGKPQLSYGYWESVGVVARDYLGGPQPYQPDGRIDQISLYGPPDEES